MSRKSALQTITASGFSHPTPSPRTTSPHIGEMPSTHNPYVLQDEIIPRKTPYTKRHHGKSSGLGLGSAGGGGKDGRSGGKNGVGGGNQGQTDDDSESSSSQDDEEADDDDEDDEDDEAEEPAVGGPVRVTGDIASVKSFLTNQSAITLKIDSKSAKRDHRTGPVSKKRSFNTAMEDEESDNDEDTASSADEGGETTAQTDGEEPDYPRKRVVTELSNTNGLLTYPGPPSVVTDDTNIEDNDEDDDEGTLITDDDFDDEDIENIEEEAIIQELQTPIKPAPVVYEYEYGLENTDLITAEELEDLDNEVFNVQWHNPNLFADINFSNDYSPYSDPFADVELEGGLFPESGSVISTPFATPNMTPRGSFSTAPQSGPSSPKYTFSDTSLGDNLNSESEDDVADLNPFFERDDPVLKHIVSTQGKGGWADDTDDENGLWKHFFSENDTYGSTDEADSEDESEEEEGDCETNGGETTDEEENLPMPTPRSKSMLRRASVSSVGSTRPQVVHVDDSSTAGPTLGSWVADPTRTICVVDGSKKTFLVPGGVKGYSLNHTNDATTASQLLMMEESESERSVQYNPTLSGLTGGNGLFLNGSNILESPEAFYPVFDGLLGVDDLGDDLIADDDEVDEFEQDLQITDFLDFSTDEGNDDAGHENNSDGEYEEGDEDDDECVPAADSSEAMLALWDQVAVTSFRKRQIQHAQGHHATNSTTPNTTKDRRLSQTITPARKKKLKQKYLAKATTGTGVRKKMPSKKMGASFGAGNQWGPLFEDL